MPATITLTCPPCFRCGVASTMEVPTAGYNLRLAGALIQDAFPDMPPEQREMLITGTHPACWDAMFADEDEEGGLDDLDA